MDGFALPCSFLGYLSRVTPSHCHKGNRLQITLNEVWDLSSKVSKVDDAVTFAHPCTLRKVWWTGLRKVDN